jgi:hypothetical protein
MNRYDRSGRRVRETGEFDLLRTMGTYGYLTAHYLAAEECRRDCIASVHLSRSLRRGKAMANGAVTPVAAIRQRLGTALIGAGRRLAGSADGGHVAEPAAEAMP